MRWWQSILTLLVALDLAIMPAAACEHETGEDKYHASIDKAMDEYNAAIKRAFEKHLRKLTARQTNQAKKGNRRGAKKLSDTILVLKREGPPLIVETKIRPLQSLMPRLKGNWVVTYTNKTQHSREIHENQLVNDGDELVQENGDLLIVFPRVIERITLIEDKLFVEHFNPCSTYPDGIPAVMGVGRRTNSK